MNKTTRRKHRKRRLETLSRIIFIFQHMERWVIAKVSVIGKVQCVVQPGEYRILGLAKLLDQF